VADTDDGARAVEQMILPTFQCFNDAMDILVDCLTTRQVPPERLKLVHGVALLDDGTPYAHAWVEEGRTCYFAGIYQGERVICAVPRQEYYQKLRVQARTKYTPWQAQRENERTTSYGPWKPAYLALTRKEDDG
jgi:hypothetical protein